MRSFNKIIDSNKEPINHNDIWFDGTSFRVYQNGEWKAVITSKGGGGGSIDPELLEGFIPLSRDFSDDFNNDFAR